MQKLKGLLGSKYQSRVEKPVLDDQTLFYIFGKIIIEEYGARGEQNITARFYKGKKLFVAAKSSLWANEIWLHRTELIQKINTKLDQEAVKEIKVESAFQ